MGDDYQDRDIHSNLADDEELRTGLQNTRLSHLVCLPLNEIRFRFDIECGIFIVDNDKFITQKRK